MAAAASTGRPPHNALRRACLREPRPSRGDVAEAGLRGLPSALGSFRHCAVSKRSLEFRGHPQVFFFSSTTTSHLSKTGNGSEEWAVAEHAFYPRTVACTPFIPGGGVHTFYPGRW